MAFFHSPAARRFIATVAAAATALALMTAAAVPARAGDRDDFAKAIAALAAIAIIGVAINSRDDYRNPRHSYNPPRGNDRATVLPAQCAVQLRGHRQNEVVYPARCLRQAGIERRLPQRCEVNLQGRGQGRTAFERNCLLQSGFREQGRRR
jgi:hypothetical protein